MSEVWKPIPGYEGLYEVSDQGRVRRVPASPAFPAGNKILKPWTNTNGYLLVTLYRDATPRKARVHRLVAETFLGHRDGLEVCHGDGTRTNNALSNLRWGTRSENMRDMVKHGTQHNHFRDRTHCANGHEFNDENTLYTAEARLCRPCRRDRVRAWRERQKEQTA